jgi:microtubule-associated protein-like 6
VSTLYYTLYYIYTVHCTHLFYLDVNHTVAVWRSSSGQWHDGYLLAHEAGDQNKVLFGRFLDGVPKGQMQHQIVTGGINHIKFWKSEHRTLKSQTGLFGAMDKVQPMLSAAVALQGVQGRAAVVSGAVSGHMYVWDGRKLLKTIKAHARCCNALYACAAGVVSGGKDGVVKLWDNSLAFMQMYDMMEAAIPPYKPAIRSVCAWLDPLGEKITKLLVGTQGSEIYEISKDTGSMLLVSEAHCADELWGLAAHPTDKDLYATAGIVRILILYSYSYSYCTHTRTVLILLLILLLIHYYCAICTHHTLYASHYIRITPQATTAP